MTNSISGFDVNRAKQIFGQGLTKEQLEIFQNNANSADANIIKTFLYGPNIFAFVDTSKDGKIDANEIETLAGKDQNGAELSDEDFLSLYKESLGVSLSSNNVDKSVDGSSTTNKTSSLSSTSGTGNNSEISSTALNAEIDNLRKEISDLEQKRNQPQIDLDAIKSQVAAEKPGLVNNIDADSKQKTLLEKSIPGFDSQITTANVVINKDKKDWKSIHDSEYMPLSREIHEIEKEIKVLNGQLNGNAEHDEGIKSKIEDKQEKLKEKAKKYDEAVKKMEKLDADIKKQELIISKANNEKKSINGQISQLTQKIEEDQKTLKEIEGKEKQISKLESEIADYDKQIKEKQDKIADIEKQIEVENAKKTAEEKKETTDNTDNTKANEDDFNKFLKEHNFTYTNQQQHDLLWEMYLNW